jgi:hypothetical protein
MCFNKNGEFAILPQYDYASDFSEGLAAPDWHSQKIVIQLRLGKI